MWLTSLLLVLFSAALHASWNLIVKRGDDRLISAWATVLVTPLVLWPVLFLTGLPGLEVWPVLVLSGSLHAAYNVALVRAYDHGNLSLVYPVARGLAPVVLNESLSPLAVAAIGLVAGGIAWLGLSARHTAEKTSGLGWALATAILIATYSIVDKVGVMRANPIAYAVVLFGCNAGVLTPYVLAQRRPGQISQVWRQSGATLIMSGLFSLGAYLCILVAMRLTQVTYVAALRESSVIFGAVLGWRVLGEPFGIRRIGASALVTMGLVMLSVAMRS